MIFSGDIVVDTTVEPESASGANRRASHAGYPIETESRSIPSLILDYGLTLLILPYVLPFIAICWLAIKLSSPKANAFYVQTRYGHGGKPFNMYKLRTMVPEADQLKADLIQFSEDKGAGFKIENDPRITKFGRILRKSHLDELPQFFNVLKGDMALVGPRANSFDPDTYEPWQRRRLAVHPGITGTWQTADVKPKEFGARCEMDIDYVENKSLLGDIAILAKTALVCLRLSGS